MRHFNQKDREDELHLRVSLQTSQNFIAELLLAQEIRMVLWNCERLILAHQLKPYRRLQRENKFDILSAIPVKDIQRGISGRAQTQANRKRLANFLNFRRARLSEGSKRG